MRKETLIAQAEALEELAADFNKHTDVGAHWHSYISNRVIELRAQAALPDVPPDGIGVYEVEEYARINANLRADQGAVLAENAVLADTLDRLLVGKATAGDQLIAYYAIRARHK